MTPHKRGPNKKKIIQRVGNESTIRQIVGTSEICDQNGDKVFKSNKSSNICSIGINVTFN